MFTRAVIIFGFLTCSACSPRADRSAAVAIPADSSTTAKDSQPAAHASATPAGSNELRQQVAADIRRFLREQEIPAHVVPAGRALRIRYEIAQIEHTPDTFLRQQGREGIQRIHDAGFEEVIIEANNPNGQIAERRLSVTELIAAQQPTGREPKVELVRARIVPFTTANGQAAQMVLFEWRNTGPGPVTAVTARITPYDSNGRALDSGTPETMIFAAEDSEPVAPGRVFREPAGTGWILLPFYGRAARVEVSITGVQ